VRIKRAACAARGGAVAVGNTSHADSGVIPANERDKVAAKISPDQIAEAQRLVRQWKPTK
jgi:hypothetical protein